MASPVPQMLLGQSSGYIERLKRQQVVPIARPTSTPSWFTYGYISRYRPSLRKTYIYMAPIRTGIRLRYEYKDEVRGSGKDELKDSYHKFSERVGFTSRGWFYSPNLAQYTFSFEPEFTQLYEERGDDVGRKNNFSPDFSLTLTAFDPKPYTLRFFASRNEIPEWSAFSGASETTEEIIGGDADLDFIPLKFIPGMVQSNIGYQYSNTETDGFYLSKSETHRVGFRSTQKSAQSNARLTIKYFDQDRRRASNRSIDNTRNKTLDALFYHYYYFESRGKSNLNSNLSYLNQNINDNTFQSFRINETVSLFHRLKFRSKYKLGYNKSKSDNGRDSDLFRAEASLNHTLYDNLFTYAGVRSHYRDNSSVASTDFNPFLEFRYTRDIPWGNFSLLPGWDYRVTYRDSDRAGKNSITDSEFVTANYGADVFLSQENIDVNTIVVSSKDFTQVYTVNVDYELEQVGNEVLIRPLPLGDINEDEVLVVRYQYYEGSTYDDAIFKQHYGIRFFFFNSLHLFYSYTTVSQDILSGPPPDRLVDLINHTAEAKFNYKWSRSRLRYENRDRGRDNSSESLYFQESLHFKPFRRSDLSLTGTIGTTDFEQQRDRSDYYGISTTFKWQPYRWCNFTFSGHYQVNENADNSSTNSGLRTALNLNYRIWQMRLYYQYLYQDRENVVNDTKRERNLVRVDIIRLKW